MLTVADTASAADPFQVDQPVPPYNPYPPLPGSTPPTVLPPDLQPEIYRVRRQVQTIFDRYFAEWQALPPSTYLGNPPILQGTGKLNMMLSRKNARCLRKSCFIPSHTTESRARYR
jgi:hypothetical protein